MDVVSIIDALKIRYLSHVVEIKFKRIYILLIVIFFHNLVIKNHKTKNLKTSMKNQTNHENCIFHKLF